MKETGNFFINHISFYDFKPEVALTALNIMHKINGRVFLYENLFFLFPEYYEMYRNTLQVLMVKDSIIPRKWKYYLAIMAVSTIKCEYLLKHLEQEFLLLDGDEDYLNFGLKFIPEKLQKLQKINNILAHQPWKLKVQDITVKLYNYL